MKKFLVVLAVFVNGLAFGQRAITKWDTWQLIEMARLDSIWIVAHPINELKLKQAILLELNKRRKENNCLPVKLSTDAENKLAENWSKFQSDNYIIGHDTAYIAKWKQNNPKPKTTTKPKPKTKKKVKTPKTGTKILHLDVSNCQTLTGKKYGPSNVYAYRAVDDNNRNQFRKLAFVSRADGEKYYNTSVPFKGIPNDNQIIKYVDNNS